MKIASRLFFTILICGIITCQKSIAQCSYDNSLYLTWAAPTIVGDSVSSACTYAGEFNRITGMVAGNTYQIYTCTNTAFDTQLSIYTAGGGLAEGFNDDFCGVQSLIFFTPIVSGNYDILIDEYNCLHNSICMDLIVKLIITPRPVITIPTVVHVVYNTPAENISNAQIQSQIDVLNLDFRRYNTDIYNAPAVFRGASYDPLIEFCLAQRDPDGFSTNGITRTSTTNTGFSGLSDSLYLDALGGKNEWDRTQYLNIWVSNLNGGLLGLGFPSSNLLSPNYQGLGVALDYTATGTLGTATLPTNLGRIGTHEVGHWLGLWHLWYQTGNIGICESDSVFDTPWQDEPTFGCPTFPLGDGCSSIYPGIMFNNHMDYTDDACKNMFTIGQSARMEASLFNQYVSLQTSQGCTPCPTINASFSSSAISICQGQTVNFTNTTTGAITYQWWDGATLFSTGINASRVFNTVGTFTIGLVATNDCIDTASITITVNPIPTANAGIDVSICSGNNTTLNASGGGNYSWSPTTALSNPNISNPVANPTSTITYTVTVTDGNGCVNSDGVTITVNQTPTSANVTGSVAPCESTSQIYTATSTGAMSYIWSLPSGWTGSSTTNTINVTVGNGSGSVCATPVNSCGNGTQGCQSATVSLLPTAASVSGNPTPNQGASETYTATSTGATSYIWSLPAGWIGSSTTNTINVTVGSISGNVCATPVNSCGNGTQACQTISIITGIDEVENNFGILIYPNPNTGQFIIEKPSDLNKEVKVKLLDATSKLIMDKIIPIGKQKIEMNITQYSSGIYYLQLIIDDEVFVKQILKD
ncbi:MAG: hypothetical protein COA97_01010 [Flavobacteriales bacterium]|nr:MAG: hypothetical protein COA97_01010 [Flavobacteriales bacterium]